MSPPITPTAVNHCKKQNETANSHADSQVKNPSKWVRKQLRLHNLKESLEIPKGKGFVVFFLFFLF